MRNKFVIACGALLLGACVSGGPLKITSQELLLKVAAGEMQPAADGRPAHGEGHVKEFEGLMSVAHQHGVKVVAAEGLEDMGLWGLYNERQHMIYLNTTLDNNGAVAVLAHEIGHVLLIGTLQPPDDDIAAQAVSYVLLRRFGMDTGEETLGYYLNYGTPKSIQNALMRLGKEIDRVVNEILDEMPKGN